MRKKERKEDRARDWTHRWNCLGARCSYLSVEIIASSLFGGEGRWGREKKIRGPNAWRGEKKTCQDNVDRFFRRNPCVGRTWRRVFSPHMSFDTIEGPPLYVKLLPKSQVWNGCNLQVIRFWHRKRLSPGDYLLISQDIFVVGLPFRCFPEHFKRSLEILAFLGQTLRLELIFKFSAAGSAKCMNMIEPSIARHRLSGNWKRANS